MRGEPLSALLLTWPVVLRAPAPASATSAANSRGIGVILCHSGSGNGGPGSEARQNGWQIPRPASGGGGQGSGGRQNRLQIPRRAGRLSGLPRQRSGGGGGGSGDLRTAPLGAAAPSIPPRAKHERSSLSPARPYSAKVLSGATTRPLKRRGLPVVHPRWMGNPPAGTPPLVGDGRRFDPSPRTVLAGAGAKGGELGEQGGGHTPSAVLHARCCLRASSWRRGSRESWPPIR